MAELSTLARPYAKAVFEMAREGKSFGAWSKQLAAIADAVAQPQIASVIGHPALARSALAEIVTGALGSELDAQGKALVRLLSDNGKLASAIELRKQFELLRAEHEARVAVEITSAVAVPDAQKQVLSAAVAKRLDRAVEITWSTDESLVAGALIRAGDLVIDGSVRGELERLSTALSRP
ncbi:MAG: F0F1 ATP synthase subunit delta [Stagnimonas sp.]|nr:F0F1 ATP synthase subunit delta [Stagnimonas sp.]